MRGVFRWSWRRGKDDLNKFMAGVVLVGVFAAIAGAVFVPASDASVEQRLASALLSLLIALLATAILTFGFAFVRAPYQQRDALRRQVREFTEAQVKPINGNFGNLADSLKVTTFVRQTSRYWLRCENTDFKRRTIVNCRTQLIGAHRADAAGQWPSLPDFLEIVLPWSDGTDTTNIPLNDRAHVCILSSHNFLWDIKDPIRIGGRLPQTPLEEARYKLTFRFGADGYTDWIWTLKFTMKNENGWIPRDLDPPLQWELAAGRVKGS